MITDAMVEAAVTCYLESDPRIESLDEIIRRALEAADGASWRDIETAPKDVHVLILEPDGGMEVAILRDSGPYWLTRESCVIEPTHWRPLPESPRSAADR